MITDDELIIDLTHIKEIINKEFYPLINNESRYLIMKGGAGSGKSHFAAQKILIRVLKDYHIPDLKHKFICLRKTAPYARKSVFALFKSLIYEWGIEDLVDFNKTDMTMEFHDGSIIMVGGLDDPEKIKSIPSITGFWLEEASEFNLEDLRQINLRLRGKFDSYYQTILTFNPITNLHWLYTEFFDPERINIMKRKTTMHHSTYLNNRFLDDGYKEELEGLADVDYQYYKIYCLGEWGSLDQLIFKDNWKVVKDFPDEVQQVVCGFDFGFKHPAAMVQLGITDEGIYIKELIYAKGKTMKQLINIVKRKIPKSGTSPQRLSNNTPIYCDSSMPGYIQDLREAGYNAIPAYKGGGRGVVTTVRDGINLLKQHKLFVTKDSNNIIKELHQYKWKEDRQGNIYDEPVKMNDDSIDAIRYAAYMHLRRKRSFGVLVIEM